MDELSANDVTDTGSFLRVATGGGSITGEYKFGNQVLSYWNHSKFTFALQQDTRRDRLRRSCLLQPMDHSCALTGEIQKKIPSTVVKSLITEEERSGLFNYAMEGLRRLLDNGGFTYKKDGMDTKREMMRSGSSIAVFAAGSWSRASETNCQRKTCTMPIPSSASGRNYRRGPWTCSARSCLSTCLI